MFHKRPLKSTITTSQDNPIDQKARNEMRIYDSKMLPCVAVAFIRCKLLAKSRFGLGRHKRPIVS
jgi:hypothetical protein